MLLFKGRKLMVSLYLALKQSLPKADLKSFSQATSRLLGADFW